MPSWPYPPIERITRGSAAAPLRRVVERRAVTENDDRRSSAPSPVVPPDSHPSRPVAAGGGPSRQAFDSLVHVAAALSEHERRLRRDGVPVPLVFADLAGLLRELVRARHDATGLFGLRNRPHDGLMTGRLLLTKAETADRLGVSVRTVERLVAAGHLLQVSVEGARRFRVADVTTYVERLARPSPTEHDPHTTGSTGPPAATPTPPTDDAGSVDCG